MDRDVVRMKGTQIERNISRLSLIAAINRVPATATGWVRELQIDTLGIQRVECKSGRDQVVPHGTDNDLLVGMINAYVQQGMPDDRLVKISVAELLGLAGLEPCGSNYLAVEEGLDRLNSALFVVFDSWWDNTHQQFTETKFHIIERFRRSDRFAKKDVVGQFRAANQLEVQLAPEITSSIRSGYLRVLSPEIYGRLKQSLARTLYRTLEEVRTPVGAATVRQYSLPLHDWATHLGIQNAATDRIRRALQPAHENLIETGYLKQVEYQGRGRGQTVTYLFGEVAPAVSATSVALLTTRGIARERAVLWAQSRNEAQLLDAIGIFEAVMARSKKVSNPAGLLLSIIEHPENYPDPAGPAALPPPPRPRSAARASTEPAASLPAASAQERCDTFLKVIKMFKLDAETLQRVAENITSGAVDAVRVSRVQGRLVRLHMDGASAQDKQAALSELL